MVWLGSATGKLIVATLCLGVNCGKEAIRVRLAFPPLSYIDPFHSKSDLHATGKTICFITTSNTLYTVHIRLLNCRCSIPQFKKPHCRKGVCM